MLRLTGEVEQRVGSRAALVGHVRFGVTSIPAVTWMPWMVRRLARAFPGMEPEFVVATKSMRRQLLEGDLDLAFLAGPLIEPSLVGRAGAGLVPGRRRRAAVSSRLRQPAPQELKDGDPGIAAEMPARGRTVHQRAATEGSQVARPGTSIMTMRNATIASRKGMLATKIFI